MTTRIQGLALPAAAAGFVARQREQADKLRKEHGIEAQSWYRITNAASPDEAEVMLYDEIGGWYGATADQFIADLRGVTSPNLRVRINSPGGSVFEGIAIANALRSHPGNVTIQVDSVAASIASVIAMAGDRVEMAPNSMLMIHDASGVCLGNAADMEEMGKLLALISDNIADAYASRAGGTREEWRAAMQAETWYLAEDAVKAGLADEALSTPKTGEPVESPDEDEPDMARAWDLAAYGYAGPDEQPKEWVTPEPQPTTLTIPIGSAIGQELFEALRKTVAHQGEHGPELVAPKPTPAEPETPAVPETPPVTDTAGPDAEPDPAPDPWTDAMSRLAQPKPAPWAEAFAHLINPQPSSSAATAA
ncbi:head maturation protease, ClpP-related [Streptomyces sp. NPDC005302]|uniref:head maturation protease, ClpP-related n=1 Tax=Streptomyces sp. NPDC005302 TaxID=3154675 RepID=UPI0033AD2150